MLTLALPSRIFVCTEPADMRRSFDGLAALVQQYLDCDPLSGDLFVFRSKRGDRVKLLYWNDDGYALWYKRLEEGTFPWPTRDGKRTVVGAHGLILRPAELAMLLDGIELANVQRRQRYQRPTPPLP
jgi:transposase